MSGTAAATLGVSQFTFGAIMAPLVGVLGNTNIALGTAMFAVLLIATMAVACLGSKDTVRSHW
jgi:DHA1 family bicyclomycin/chloramphenicol resistance-like MFS transporter